MRKAAGIFVALALAAASLPSAFAQANSDGSNADPRFLSVQYSERGVVHINTASETIQTVLFAPGEMIRSVLLSNPSAYAVTISGTGDSLTLAPKGLFANVVMSVETALRSYEFELTPGSASAAPNIVRFSYRGQMVQPPRPIESIVQAPGIRYKISGSRDVRPSLIRDDGAKTYIVWADEQPIPAVFAIGPGGKEEMVDGYVRGGIFTIDRVYRQIIFRIDDKVAEAGREIGRKSHGQD